MSFDLNEINTGDVKSSEQDYVGYTVKTFESGLYKAKITQCYGITPNDKQAKTKGLHFDFEIESTNEDGNIELSEFSTWLMIRFRSVSDSVSFEIRSQLSLSNF